MAVFIWAVYLDGVSTKGYRAPPGPSKRRPSQHLPKLTTFAKQPIPRQRTKLRPQLPLEIIRAIAEARPVRERGRPHRPDQLVQRSHDLHRIVAVQLDPPAVALQDHL